MKKIFFTCVFLILVNFFFINEINVNQFRSFSIQSLKYDRIVDSIAYLQKLECFSFNDSILFSLQLDIVPENSFFPFVDNRNLYDDVFFEDLILVNINDSFSIKNHISSPKNFFKIKLISGNKFHQYKRIENEIYLSLYESIDIFFSKINLKEKFIYEYCDGELFSLKNANYLDSIVKERKFKKIKMNIKTSDGNKLFFEMPICLPPHDSL